MIAAGTLQASTHRETDLTAEALMPGFTGATGHPGHHARLAQLLGLAPLVAVTSTFGIGLRLGLMVLLAHGVIGLLIAGLRRQMTAGVLLPVVLLILAALLTAAELLCKAFFYDFYLTAGTFLPLIMVNGMLLTGTVGVDDRQALRTTLIRALRQGAECALLLCALGALREIIGMGFTLALVPAGAFFALALLAVARAAIPAT